MTNEQSACDLFGGKQRLRELLVGAIRNERIRRGISPRELYDYLRLGDEGYVPNIIEQIENGEKHLDGYIAEKAISVLGRLDRLMPLPLFANEGEEGSWMVRYLTSGCGVFRGTTERELGGLDDELCLTEKPDFDDNIQLELFIRFQALEELNIP